MTNLSQIANSVAGGESQYLSLKDYFYAFVSALAGVILGILWSEFQMRRKTRLHHQALRRDFLNSFAEISKYVTQAIGQLEGLQLGKLDGSIPNYTLDSITLIRLVERAHTGFSSAMLRDIDALRYQLSHIENKMQMLYSLAVNSDAQTALRHPEFSSVLAHLKQALEWISQRKRDMEKAA